MDHCPHSAEARPRKTYDFAAILAAGTEISEELADRLFEAGCDDSTPGIVRACSGVALRGFGRVSVLMLETLCASRWGQCPRDTPLATSSVMFVGLSRGELP